MAEGQERRDDSRTRAERIYAALQLLDEDVNTLVGYGTIQAERVAQTSARIQAALDSLACYITSRRAMK